LCQLNHFECVRESSGSRKHRTSIQISRPFSLRRPLASTFRIEPQFKAFVPHSKYVRTPKKAVPYFKENPPYFKPNNSGLNHCF
jgi:hypothetical protein